MIGRDVRLGHLVSLVLPQGGRRALMRAGSSTLVRRPCPVPGSSLGVEAFLAPRGALNLSRMAGRRGGALEGCDVLHLLLLFTLLIGCSFASLCWFGRALTCLPA